MTFDFQNARFTGGFHYKYFLSNQFSDELSVLAGKTIPVFGLQFPQHIFFINDNLLIGVDTAALALKFFPMGNMKVMKLLS